MTRLADLELPDTIAAAARAFIHEVSMGAEPDELPAYPRISRSALEQRPRATLLVASPAGLCVCREADDWKPHGKPEELLGGVQCHLLAWSDVRGFDRSITYGVKGGQPQPLARRYQLSIETPPLPTVQVDDTDQPAYADLADFAAGCDHHLLGIAGGHIEQT